MAVRLTNFTFVSLEKKKITFGEDLQRRLGQEMYPGSEVVR